MQASHSSSSIDAQMDVDAQLNRLFQQILISSLAGIGATAPIFLFTLPWPFRGVVVGAQLIAAIFLLAAIVQLRSASRSRAILLSAIGYPLALAMMFISVGLQASMPFLVVALLPVSWVALLGEARLTWATIVATILTVCVAALEQLGLPWVGFVPAFEQPALVTVLFFAGSVITIGSFLIQAGQALRRSFTGLQQHAAELEAIRASLETTVAARTESLQQALVDVQTRETHLREVLTDLRTSQETIRELSVPVIPVLPGVLVTPLVGALDGTRAALITEQTLRAVEQRAAQAVIFDVTGMPLIDTQVAQVLLDTARAVQLLGARVVIVGIRPEVAQTIVALQVDLSSVVTFTDLQEAVTAFLHVAGWQRQAAVR